MAKLLKRKTTPEPEPVLVVEPVLLPEPEPEPVLPEPEERDRREQMLDYASRQDAKGHAQVKLWVPKACIPWMHRLADDMRRLSELGLDPLTAHQHVPAVANPLPDVLFIRVVAERKGAEA